MKKIIFFISWINNVKRMIQGKLGNWWRYKIPNSSVSHNIHGGLPHGLDLTATLSV